MRKAIKITILAASLVVTLAVIATLSLTYLAQQQPYRGVAIEELAKLYEPEVAPLGAIVIKTYREYRGNTVRWSAAYFGCLFGSAFLSALAALILKLELLESRPKLKNDLAASFATVAALLITLSTTGDFQRKWHANRVAATAMENLAYELSSPSAASRHDDIIQRIQEINQQRNLAIIGVGAEHPAQDSR